MTFHHFQIVFDALTLYWLLVVAVYLYISHGERRP